MASRLVYIKSASLLPKYEEESQDLKRELEGQLLEYQECRRVAALLGQMATYDVYGAPAMEIEYDMTYNGVHRPREILSAYLSAAGRGRRRLPPPKEAFSGIVERKIVSVNSRIIFVMNKLWSGAAVKYRSLFKQGSGKSELVATFLAVLELVKGKRLVLEGDGDDPDVRLIKEGKRA